MGRRNEDATSPKSLSAEFTASHSGTRQSRQGSIQSAFALRSDLHHSALPAIRLISCHRRRGTCAGRLLPLLPPNFILYPFVQFAWDQGARNEFSFWEARSPGPDTEIQSCLSHLCSLSRLPCDDDDDTAGVQIGSSTSSAHVNCLHLCRQWRWNSMEKRKRKRKRERRGEECLPFLDSLRLESYIPT